jgi:hypothetical protein
MKIKIILLSLLFFSCAQQEASVFIDPELRPYVESYSAYSKRELGSDVLLFQKISIFFIEKFDSPTQNGVCHVRIRTNGQKIEREIIISRYWWDRMSEGERASLVYHELGHCSLMRPHTTNDQSIMYPHTIDISENTDFYVKELFQGSVLFNLNNPYYFLDRFAIAFVGMNSKGENASEYRSYIGKQCSGLVYEH